MDLITERPNNSRVQLAAVSCNPNGCYLAGLKMGLGLTGKPGCACVGAWVVVWWGGGGGYKCHGRDFI